MIDYLKQYSFIFSKDSVYNTAPVKSPNYKLPYNYLSANKDNIKSHIDISSGRGRFLKIIKPLNLNTIFTDLKKFTDLNLPFIRCDLSKSEDLYLLKGGHYDVLTCLDVLEHIEPGRVDDILKTFSEIADVCIFTIANHEDIVCGVKLHLIVEGVGYWSDKLLQYFRINKQEVLVNGTLFYFELEPK